MKSKIPHVPALVALTVVVSSPALFALCAGFSDRVTAAGSESRNLNLDGVYGLLDVLDAIMARHPNYVEEIGRFRAMDNPDRRRLIDDAIAKHEQDQRVVSSLDALYATAAYPMYFARFKNITLEAHRRIILALPFTTQPSPADISSNLQELCSHREAVRSWANDVAAKIDLDSCRSRAQRWLPSGQYDLPIVHFIYDGNGDAFASSGAVCFDLFGVVVSRLPVRSRFDDLAHLGVERIESVLAHELHHVFSNRLGGNRELSLADWRARQQHHLAWRFVSEGVAMRCDLEEGVRREAMEDSATVLYWIGQLNEKLAEIVSGAIDEDTWFKWYNTTYHELASQRLREFLARTRPGDDLDVLMERYGSARPSLDYTLGWWMISRILDAPGGYDTAMRLLSAPDQLFSEYDRAIGDAPREFHVVVP